MSRKALRIIFGVLAVGGFCESARLYVGSFFEQSIGDFGSIVPLLGISIVLLAGSIQILNFRTLKGRSFFWKLSDISCGKWAPTVSALACLFPVGNLAWICSQGFVGIPTTINGQHVIDEHGTIIQVLSEVEYKTCLSWELRLISAIFLTSFLSIALYWLTAETKYSDGSVERAPQEKEN